MTDVLDSPHFSPRPRPINAHADLTKESLIHMALPNPARRDQIISMYELGLSIAGIARKLGIRRNTVAQYLKRSGIHDTSAPRAPMAKCSVCGERTRLPPGVPRHLRKHVYTCKPCRQEQFKPQDPQPYPEDIFCDPSEFPDFLD